MNTAMTTLRCRVSPRGAIARTSRAALALLMLLAAAVFTPARANTYVVRNSGDAGMGSLRQAILDANAQQATGGTQCAPHTITFEIPGDGSHTIQLLSPLPRINIPITFDGYSQPGSSPNTLPEGSNAIVGIELDGSLAGATTDAIVIGASIPGSALCPGTGSIIRGFAINRFAGAAVSMGEESCPIGACCLVGGVWIQGNYFGTDASGTVALGNGGGGGRPALLFGDGSIHNIVGDEVPEEGGPTDPLPQTRNVISGNAADAILITSTSSTCLSSDHRIRNNYVGLNADGDAALPNGGRGVTVGVNGSVIAIEDNLISANAGGGVAVLDGSFPGSVLARNGIGIGVGALPFGNGGDGVLVAGVAIATVGGRFRLAPTAASIANNAGAGVFVADFALVDAGAVSSADNAGLGIDLAPAGVNPNHAGDGATGPNELLNTPVIESVDLSGTIVGTLSAGPSMNYEIAFFLNDACDPSGFGGGQTPFPLSPPPSSVHVTTDAIGNASFTRQTEGLPPGRFLTAVTRRFSTTSDLPALVVSEFSNCVPIASSVDPIFKSGFE